MKAMLAAFLLIAVIGTVAAVVLNEFEPRENVDTTTVRPPERG